MSKVDAMDLLDRAAGYCHAAGNGMLADELTEARAAVAELIATADTLTDAITFRIDDPRAALLDAVVKAIARCKREAN